MKSGHEKVRYRRHLLSVARIFCSIYQVYKGNVPGPVPDLAALPRGGPSPQAALVVLGTWATVAPDALELSGAAGLHGAPDVCRQRYHVLRSRPGVCLYIENGACNILLVMMFASVLPMLWPSEKRCYHVRANAILLFLLISTDPPGPLSVA